MKLSNTNHLTIVHNPGAGYEQPSIKGIIKDLEQKGFDVRYLRKEGNYKSKMASYLKEPGEMVIVAGGDGTVKKVAEHLIDSNVPIAIMPFGSANNIARTFGIKEFKPEQLAEFKNLERKRLDVATVKGDWGEKFFIESTGIGLIAAMMQSVKEKLATTPVENFQDKLDLSLDELVSLLGNYPEQKVEITIDGEDISGEYLFAEALNHKQMGPWLTLAPDARPDDQLLDLVVLRPSDKQAFKDYILKKKEGLKPESTLPVYQFRKLKMNWPEGIVHIDGKLKKTRSKPVIIEAGTGSLVFLVPSKS